jgi:hypothetical protein
VYLVGSIRLGGSCFFIYLFILDYLDNLHLIWLLVDLVQAYSFVISFLSFFCGTGLWTHAFALARQVLYYLYLQPCSSLSVFYFSSVLFYMNSVLFRSPFYSKFTSYTSLLCIFNDCFKVCNIYLELTIIYFY